MSQIFISYAREDRAQAERLAKALEDHGWSVWWDRSIPAGKNYDEVIERALGEAGCVLVLWSEESVSSSWVRAEAGEGLERKTLVPVLLGEVQMPLAFRQLQAVGLAGWKGDLDNVEFQKLVSAISRILESEPVRPPEAPHGQRRRGLYATLAALPVLAIGGYYSLTTPEMVKVPAGPFQMGTSGEREAQVIALLARFDVKNPAIALEREPPRVDNLDEFYIDAHEVTIGEYRSYLKGSLPAGLGTAPEDHPVTRVTWEDARSYCLDRSKRLPTEEEWEKAARGETERIYPWGDTEIDPTRANYCNAGCDTQHPGAGDDGFSRTAPVGTYREGTSPYGVHDMAGNVAEWVDAWYFRDRDENSDAADASGSPKPEFRVVRGGGWRSHPPFLRTAYRGYAAPETGNAEIGFRCAAHRSVGRRWRFSTGG